MSEDLQQLEAWAAGMLEAMSAAERRKLAKQVATDLRRSQAARIAAQKNPVGSAYAPRKPKKAAPIRSRQGRIRKAAAARKAPRRAGAMFRKLRTAAWLTQEATAEEASVGFRSATAARVARVHQLGLRDKVSKGPRAPEVTYPARVLLGFTEADRAMLLDRVLARLTK